MSSIASSILDDFKKSRRGDQGIGLSSSNPSKIDLATDLRSGSTLAANYDKMSPSNSNDLFRSLNI
jgi:hypothetical protein